MTTKARAIDELADVLANNNVTFASQTTAGRIEELAGMIQNGTITIGGELPTASADTLGGVKVGGGLAIDSAGVLSASGGGGGESWLAVANSFDADTQTYTTTLAAGTVARLNAGVSEADVWALAGTAISVTTSVPPMVTDSPSKTTITDVKRTPTNGLQVNTSADDFSLVFAFDSETGTVNEVEDGNENALWGK